MTNVTPTPPPGGPRAVTTPNPRARQNQILILAVFVIALVLLVRACAGGENRYEKIAHEFTQAVQSNDLASVAKLENAEIAAETTRTQVAHGADVLAPLGKIQRVRENTPKNDPARVHEFDVTFEKATVHEKFQFDPNDKVFRWKYDPPVPKT
ncbi:MAG: hypothetical protein JOZ86_11285 [Candidatus Eremiobacteraeota bacterium]|nr:hypothetical protein [Candidatus Eremiobacteraeota bacterium]